ncbi:MAG: nitroreductase [Elusimicrobia bacterium RIFOXYA2_FULL_58_8]|nr:MAG: nitroreductase [Elusimicrobia bacterium RIFOXYA12_FULL_57_11]OGS17342.1 MAG: nitroreductase [Elusimicrobia bacterium RIFOXYA2_FULL_58_8]
MNIIDAVEGRRAINYFDPQRKIPGADLDRLLELANLAPSSMNLQPWRVVAVASPEKKKLLRECAMGQPKVEEASVVLIIAGETAAVETNIAPALDSWVKLGYMDPKTAAGYQGFAGKLYGDPAGERRRLFAVKNAAFFGMSVMLAARGLGLETHPVDGFDEERVKKEFGISAGAVIPLLICVGYLKPGAKLLPRAFRRELKDFIETV